MKRTFIKYFLIICILSTTGILYSQDDKDYSYEYALIEASRQKSLGNLQEAVGLYKKCLEAKPESGAAAFELGSIYASVNDFIIAEEYLEQAYKNDPYNYWYLLAYTEVLKKNSKEDKAEKILVGFLKKNEDINLKYSLSGIYVKGGKYKKALELLDNIEKDNGLSELIVLKKVDIFKIQKEYGKAEKEIYKLIDLMPELAGYKIIMAEFYNEIEKPEKAIKLFSEAFQQDSTNIYAITSLADYYTSKNDYKTGFFYLNKALALPEVKLENKVNTLVYYIERDEFVNEYKEEIKQLVNTMSVNYPVNVKVKSMAYDFYNKTGDYEIAYTIINELVEDNTDDLGLWQQAVFAASMLNRYEDIINTSDRALKIFPNKKIFYVFKGIALYQKELYDSCYNVLYGNYELGLEMGVQIQFLTFLGESAYKTGRVDEAFSYFEELLLLDPGNMAIMNNYSYYLSLENKNLERALELSKKTIDSDPENLVYLDTYGWILFKKGKYDEALIYIEKAVKESNDADVLFHYAEIQFKLGNINIAKSFYKKAGEAGYNEKIIEEKLLLCQ